MPTVNRIDNVTPAPSPTGTPVIPPVAIPWVSGVLAIAISLAAIIPSHTVGFKLVVGVGGLCAFLLGIGPGWRRQG